MRPIWFHLQNNQRRTINLKREGAPLICLLQRRQLIPARAGTCPILFSLTPFPRTLIFRFHTWSYTFRSFFYRTFHLNHGPTQMLPLINTPPRFPRDLEKWDHYLQSSIAIEISAINIQTYLPMYQSYRLLCILKLQTFPSAIHKRSPPFYHRNLKFPTIFL